MQLCSWYYELIRRLLERWLMWIKVIISSFDLRVFVLYLILQKTNYCIRQNNIVISAVGSSSWNFLSINKIRQSTVKSLCLCYDVIRYMWQIKGFWQKTFHVNEFLWPRPTTTQNVRDLRENHILECVTKSYVLRRIHFSILLRNLFLDDSWIALKDRI